MTVGGRIEADVVEFKLPAGAMGNGAGGTALQTWAPPAVVQSVPMVFPDDVETQVFRLSGGKQLVGVVELVSPANKDRPEHRRAFAAKCVAYLQRGIGLVVVDVVTERRANLHLEVLELLGQLEGEATCDGGLYAVAYRPTRRQESNLLDLWPSVLRLGEPLPVLPLALRGAFAVPVDLEPAYADACRHFNLGPVPS